MWEIYTYGGGQFLNSVFNGVAMIFGNGNYVMALMIAATLGLLSVILMAAFQRGQLNVNWIMGIIFVYLGLFVPRTEVIITDRVVAADSSVVANVPIGLSLPATVFSHFSDWITGVAETVFSLPNQIGYRGNGMLFANYLVDEASRFEITDPRLQSNYSEFWKSCVYYDLLLGRYTWQQLANETNLVAWFPNNTSRTRSFVYTNEFNVRNIEVCREGAEFLENDFDDEVARATNIYGAKLIPGEVDNNAAVAKFAASMPVAFEFLTGMAENNATIIGQNAVSNSLRRGLINFASEVDAPAAAQDFAIAKAEAERRTTFLVMGHLAEKMLPIMHHLFESFIYIGSIFIFIIMMTPLAGKAGMAYVKVLFWINLWPPLFAVLNFAVTFYSQGAGEGAVIQDQAFNSGLTFATHTGLGKVMEDYKAIAGYLMVSIPMIAWMMVSMSGAMMAGLAGRLMQGYERPAAKAADEASSGNVNLGNTSYMNTSAFQHNSSPTVDSGLIRERTGAGSMEITSGAARYLEMNKSSGPANFDSRETVMQASSKIVSEANTAVNSERSQQTDANIATLGSVASVLNSVSQSDTATDSTRDSVSNMREEARAKLDQAVDEYAQQQGIENSQALRAAVYAQAEIQAKGGTPLSGIIGSGVSVSAKGGTGVEGSMTDTEKTTFNQAERFLSSDQFSDTVREIAQSTKEMASTQQFSGKDEAVDSLTSNLNTQTSNQRELSAAVETRNEAVEQQQRLEQIVASYGQDKFDAVKNYAEEKYDMGGGKFEQLIIEANQNDPDASQKLQTIVYGAYMDGIGDGSDFKNGTNFAGEKERIVAEGEAAVEAKETAGKNAVTAANTTDRQAVGISGENVRTEVTWNNDNIGFQTEVAFFNSNVRISGEDIAADTQEAKQRIEMQRDLSENGPPLAAGIVAEGERENQIDGFKDGSREDMRELLKKANDSK